MPGQSFSEAFDKISAALGGGETVLLLPIDLIDEDPDNPRTRFDEAELAALAATIGRKGLLQPLTVRPQGADGRYRLRFGARRLRAAKLAGLQDVRALVQAEETDAAEAIVEQLIENDQREGLSTAELAQAVARLLELDLKQAEIGRRLGRPKEQIAMLAAIRDMPAELRAMAPRLGVRTLYELFGAWKADQGRTKVWLAGRDPSTITQADARELAGRPAPSRQVVRDPADGSVRDLPKAAVERKAERGRARDVQAATPSPAGARTPQVEVEAGDARGVLILDAIGRATDRVRIRLADGVVITAPAAEVRIVRLRPG